MIPAFLAPYVLRIGMVAALLAAIGGGFLYVKIHYENIGFNKAIAAVAAKDKGALDAANKAKALVDQCYSSGHSWSTVDGMCH